MNVMIKKTTPLLLNLCAVAILAGCATEQGKKQIPRSVLASDSVPETNYPLYSDTASNTTLKSGYESLTPLTSQRSMVKSQLDLSNRFSDDAHLTISADEMPGKEFIHTVFGEQLKVNYVIAEGLANLEQSLSLNIQDAVSPKALFVLAVELLASRQIDVTFKDGVYYIGPKEQGRQKSSVLGYGRRVSDVPNMPGLITQLVPVMYNQDISIERTISELTNVQVTLAGKQSAYYFRGERQDIIRALEILDILDNPSSRGRHVGLLRLTYISTKEFSQKLAEILASEGLPVDVDKAQNRNLVLIPIEQIGAIALFATEKLYVDRVSYWAQQLDKPTQTNDKQYFMFYPRFARATDLGESIAALLGSSSNSSGNRSRDTQTAMPADSTNIAQDNQSNVQADSSTSSAQPSVSSVKTENITMTVDARSNAIIFYTTGKHYQDLLPMIERLDTMPKQIILEATIAEVTLTDEFSMGLEFALKNGKFSTGTIGAFGLDKIGGLGFTLLGSDSIDKITGQMTQKDSKINVLSSPSIVVRDGVTANIAVGNDIPIVTASTTNPLDPDATRSITSQGYRKTGVTLSVTPTISAQGLVVMEIKQSISNQADSDAETVGNPAIFERKLETEVIAQSGQTILLGGLMSENKNTSKTKVPFLGDLPLLGHLFRSEKDSTVKTELILMITPRVIDNTSQWQGIRQKLSEGLELINLPEEKSSN